MGRVGTESEEVAPVPIFDLYVSPLTFKQSFYNGSPLERDILTRVRLGLIKYVDPIYKIRIACEWTEDFMIKYLWSAADMDLLPSPC